MNEFKINNLNEKRAGYPFSEYDEFPITYSPVKAGVYNIYLYGTIESSQQFIGAVEVLNAATENDIVVIHLQTNGGSLDATDTLLQAMSHTDGRVIVKASGGVHSSGTIILLHADEFTLSDNSNFLIHNGSTGTGGKYSDYKAETAYTLKHMEKVLRHTYTGFLSDAEMEDLLRGVDLWLGPEEFCERYNKRNQYFLAKEAAAKAPAKKPRKKKEAPPEL